MKIIKLFLTLSIILCANVTKPCTTNADCGAGRLCQHPGFGIPPFCTDY
jgi:Cys-rich repeat protein